MAEGGKATLADAIVGLREEDQVILEDLLMYREEVHVISIVGMPGVGKSTLSSTLYNNPSVNDHFDCRAWCTVSQSYQIRALLLSMIDQVKVSDQVSNKDDQVKASDQDSNKDDQVKASDQVSNKDDQDLADHLCRILKRRRSLIVLDDVWDTGFWTYLKTYIPYVSGNRVLITTRNRDVAVQIGSKVNELHRLSKESSLRLFKKKIPEIESLSENLMNISEEIVERCEGLPLSIVIIAGILSTIKIIERTEKRWMQIAESVRSIVSSDPQGKCKAILGLSYNHLPNDLKSCFLYLGSFPEGKEISVNHLASRWIAEGLVRDTETDSAEEVVNKYIGDLIAKSLVIPAKIRSLWGVKTFLLHDLLHDFCLDKVKEKQFLTFLDKTTDIQLLQDSRRVIINEVPIKGLDFSYQSIRSMICYDEFDIFEIMKGIRSCNMVLLEVLEVDIVWSKLFQVLDEGDIWSNSFPDISSLAQLRYLALGLEGWAITSLPASICKLQNLQTLILRFESLVKVPDLIWEMVKLRHVHISPTASFEVDSNRLESSSFMLENLRYLSRAQVSCDASKWLSKLLGVQRLSCVLVEDDKKVNNLEDNKLLMLSFNGHLTSLKLENETGQEQRFISKCQLPNSLRELTLSRFFFTSDDMSEIGRTAPHLELLKIFRCDVPSRYKWKVGNDDFPSLKVLKLSTLNICEWVVSEDSFPSLEELWLEDCHYLYEIPLDFGYLQKLRLISVRECAPSVGNSARKVEKQQHEDQNTEMTLHMHLYKSHFDSHQMNLLEDNDAMVGLNDEARSIMEYLLTGTMRLDVISIVGMAGIGKTTLASTLFKSRLVADHFDVVAWCTVAQSYQYRDVLVSILDQIRNFDWSSVEILDDADLSGNVFRYLRKQRYLIVLDDIWDTELCNYLNRYCPNDRCGSRILVTTRNKEVADRIGSKLNELHVLSKEESWELFQKKIIGHEGLSDDLLEILKKIVEECKGLPLSIVIIAGILSDTERTTEKWNQIAESVSSLILSSPRGSLFYNQLPHHLRSCFLYLGSFPKDQDISVDHLTSLWIAEGFIQDRMTDSAEELAKKYIEDLIVKSLVIPTKEGYGGRVKALRLQNHLHKFCLDEAKENHFFTVLDHINHSRPLEDPRRLIINVPHSLDFSCHNIQSMICYHPLKSVDVKKSIRYDNMRRLKVLRLCEVYSELFPNISSLVHLRYLSMLNLQNWRNSVLPSSISKLQNLQFLILTCTDQVIQVPDSIWDMAKLRHIHIGEKASFEVDGNRLGSTSFLLENLRYLSRAQVSCDASKWLSKLLGVQRLSCVFVEDDKEVNNLEDNKLLMLSFNWHLTSLKLENATGREQRFISKCLLPYSLRELTLSRFFFTSDDMSEIGRTAPHLELLKIFRCYVPSRYKWKVGNDDFPSLKVLKLSTLNICEWVVSEDSFPSLEELWLEDCNHLYEIPLDFGSLLKLRLISVRECAPSVGNSARKVEKQQHEDQNTEMRLHMHLHKSHFDSHQMNLLEDNDAIVGLNDEARSIMEYLLTGTMRLDVISIVGMAGTGKTTLASTLFKSRLVADHFDVVAWCTVSQSYQYGDVLVSLLDQIRNFDWSSVEILNDVDLSINLSKCLRKRRYLIVLDDIWDTELCNYLNRYCPDDRCGSRILITTRNKEVADRIGSKLNELHVLSKEESWELFQKKIIGHEGLSDDLLEILKKLVEECKGLPLSIVIIAGILSDTERTMEKWNQIAESVSSLILSSSRGSLFYYQLPHHLRSCFLYLGSFPTDQDILVDHLTSLWIAEGFIQDTMTDSAEELAKKYIEDLIWKNLVIPTKEGYGGRAKALRLKNHLHKFCLDEAKENHFFTVLDHINHSRPLEDPRRLIINVPHSLDFSCHNIQSMICYHPLKSVDVKKSIRYDNMRRLKVLRLCEVYSELFPNISSLVHLRYLSMLNLQNWRNSVLPSSISKLQNLQFLILTCTYQVIQVPDFIWDMAKLRHIHIGEKASFEVDGNRLGSSSFLLENLRYLSNAVVSCDNSKWLSKLLGLQRLRCVFVKTDDVTKADEDTEKGYDLGMDDVTKLDDDTKVDDDNEVDDVIEHNQFRMVSFNSHLTSLKVRNAVNGKQRFIRACHLPINLRELTLSEFFLTSNDISEFGRALYHLEVLKIYSCNVPSRFIWIVDDEDFFRLKVLKLRDTNISTWIAEDSFANLEKLLVEQCLHLDKIPLDFGYLPCLRLISVRDCAPSVDDSAREIEKVQHDFCNYDMRAFIYPSKV